MQFVLYTNCISPHQLPLAQEIVKRIGSENYRYIYTEELEAQRQQMGWGRDCNQAWCISGNENNPELLECDFLFSELRVLDVFAKRLSQKMRVGYVSERWFKPPKGVLRLLSPSYWKMARRFVSFLDSPYFTYFPQGIHAARDMMRIQGLVHGDWHCLYQAPKVAFEAKPGGRIIPLKQAINEGLLSDADIARGNRFGFVRVPQEKWGNMGMYRPWRNYRLWGYFVAPSKGIYEKHKPSATLKLFWAGRMLDWKRVETLVDAVPSNMELHLYGHGPDEENIRKHANGKTNVHFHDYVPIEQVRSLMHEHDIYVLPSDGGEGWGAVVNEALEEKMTTLATWESGAGATMLEACNLFSSGNASELNRMLKTSSFSSSTIGYWNAEYAADFLNNFISDCSSSK